MQLIFMSLHMNGVAAVAAIFNVVLIFTADIQGDMSGVTTERAKNSFMQYVHRSSVYQRLLQQALATEYLRVLPFKAPDNL
jgi:hypothetical protein